jgi:hypothetical protein
MLVVTLVTLLLTQLLLLLLRLLLLTQLPLLVLHPALHPACFHATKRACRSCSCCWCCVPQPCHSRSAVVHVLQLGQAVDGGRAWAGGWRQLGDICGLVQQVCLLSQRPVS